MLRDIERDAPIEADHIIGDLIPRRAHTEADSSSLLQVAYANLKVMGHVADARLRERDELTLRGFGARIVNEPEQRGRDHPRDASCGSIRAVKFGFGPRAPTRQAAA